MTATGDAQFVRRPSEPASDAGEPEAANADTMS